ncbi:MAG: MltA domain-containing protein, partial [Burkholderiales bacterium]|nr:MltA domain-containing protein [Burkholderiales bacterium]
MSSNHILQACHAIVGLAILGVLAGCASSPRPAMPPTETPAPQGPASAPAPALGSAAPASRPPRSGPAPAKVPTRARWLPASWSELPGFDTDPVRELWPALLASCTRPAPGWSRTCARILLEPPPASDETARRWLMGELQPWRVQAWQAGPAALGDESPASEAAPSSAVAPNDMRALGLATGYFEPELAAARRPQGRFRVPLYAPPPELLGASALRKPYYTRQQLETLPQARAALRGREIAWIEDPLDALMLQVQGSGRLRVLEPDGRTSRVRLSFAAHNEQPYRSLGRWLVDQGELSAEQASWPAIKAWAQRNPARADELRWANPRVVFFREEPLSAPELGPIGAQGVPLTPGRSVAVDPRAVPLGTLLWLDTTEPMSPTPLRRLVVAQDTGSAIVGPVRVDLFFGWQPGAEELAGRMKQPLRLWALWPQG